MTLFTLANITFETGSSESLYSNAGLGIIIGLFLGKPLGIFFTSWFCVKMKITDLLSKAKCHTWQDFGLLGGIGFTMSIFIALFSFQDTEHQNIAKFAMLYASALY